LLEEEKRAHLERVVEEEADDGRDEHHRAREKGRQRGEVPYPSRVYRQADLFEGCVGLCNVS